MLPVEVKQNAVVLPFVYMTSQKWISVETTGLMYSVITRKSLVNNSMILIKKKTFYAYKPNARLCSPSPIQHILFFYMFTIVSSPSIPRTVMWHIGLSSSSPLLQQWAVPNDADVVIPQEWFYKDLHSQYVLSLLGWKTLRHWVKTEDILWWKGITAGDNYGEIMNVAVGALFLKKTFTVQLYNAFYSLALLNTLWIISRYHLKCKLCSTCGLLFSCCSNSDL